MSWFLVDTQIAELRGLGEDTSGDDSQHLTNHCSRQCDALVIRAERQELVRLRREALEAVNLKPLTGQMAGQLDDAAEREKLVALR
jgi:hypothetical protein